MHTVRRDSNDACNTTLVANDECVEVQPPLLFLTLASWLADLDTLNTRFGHRL
jgi:hypothetical protein